MIEELAIIDKQMLNLEKLIEDIAKRKTKPKLRAYLHSIFTIKENLTKLKRKLRRLPIITEDDVTDKNEANELIEEMLLNIKERERVIASSKVEDLNEDVLTLRSIFSELSGSIPIEQIMFLVDYSCIPHEIREEMKLNFEEIRKCYFTDALRSAIGMCGRVLELMLARKYFEVMNVDPIEQRWFIGTLIRRCIDDNVINDPGLAEICNLINRSRISSVHTSRRIYRPSQEETKSLIEFTIGLLKRLYPPNDENS